MGKTIRRRRIENKTDYKARLTLLKSGKPRLVVRKTNKYVIVQIVEANVAQDKILVGVTSKDLLSHGWPADKSGSLKSIPAAYLTGMLLAAKAKKTIKEGVLDIGMYRNVKGSRLYAVLRGVVDGGIPIPHSKDSLPKDEDLKRNDKLTPILEKLKKEIK